MAGTTDWLDHARAALREDGRRTGGARAAVIAVLAQQGCCLTAQEIAVRVRAGGRGAGLGSVYRALELLTELGLVQRLELGDGSARYEPMQPDGDHHHHVVCDECGRITAFEDDALEQALARLGRRLGHDVGGHEVVLHGACGDCRSASP
jgi:Fur family ferric uptake transcriptional regulator